MNVENENKNYKNLSINRGVYETRRALKDFLTANIV